MRQWEQLRDEECTITQAAAQIGISRTGLHDAIDRARRAGDARARTTTLDKTTLDRLRALVGAPR